MSFSDLKGKAIEIVTTQPILADSVQEALQKRGAYVNIHPFNPSGISGNAYQIAFGVKHAKPKIDALVIQNPVMEIEHPVRSDNKKNYDAVFEIINDLKKICPVIVCEQSDNPAISRAVRDAGATFVNHCEPQNTEDARIVAAVADAIAQHGKPGRQKF